MVTLPTPSPKFQKFGITKAVFRLKHGQKILNTPKICSRIGNSPWGFQILGYKFDRKWNSGRFCACAAENWLKIPEIMVQFSKFLVI